MDVTFEKYLLTKGFDQNWIDKIKMMYQICDRLTVHKQAMLIDYGSSLNIPVYEKLIEMLSSTKKYRHEIATTICVVVRQFVCGM